MKNINQTPPSIKSKNPSWQQFKIAYNHNQQSKVIQQALIFLKLRDYGCPKQKALNFAQKKLSAIDTTKTKDGPAGYQKLIPQKTKGLLRNGWIKGQKLHFRELQGVRQQASPRKSQPKYLAFQKNKQARAKLQQQRLQLKRKHKQLLTDPSKPKILLQQIGLIKDEFVKTNQKRNLFLTYHGVKLAQHTRNYFENIKQQNPQSLITQLDTFNSLPNNNQIILQPDDHNNVKWRSYSAHQIQGQAKRNKLFTIRKNFSNLKINLTNNVNKNTLRNSHRKFMWASLGKPENQKNNQQLKQFYERIEKIAFLKSKQIPMQNQPLNNQQFQ